MVTKKASTKKATTRVAANGKTATSKASKKSATKARATPKAAPAAARSAPVSLANAREAAAAKAGSKAKSKSASAPKPSKKKSAAEAAAGLDVGDSAPGFVLQDDTGALVSSDSLRGSPYVIYFYPKDDTPGCTLQACGFRDSMPRFAAKGVHVVGVSPDTKESHARFRKKYELTFPLLSDPEKTLAKAYGVWVMKQNYGREYMGVQRSTFYVDRHGVIRKVWRSVRVPGHVDEVVHSV
jgi:peroxiredoxin Q/BCP